MYVRVNEHFKRMKMLIVFRVMFGLLVHMLIIVEAHAICQTVYNGVLVPCDIIQRLHDRRENYYKLERLFKIKRDYPGEQYSSLKLFWPEDAPPYFNRERITFYKCINRTPTIAKTLMHIIRGGTGTPELVVDVMYAPVRYRLMNRLIITCHIFTARDDSLGNMQKQPWNQFDIERPNDENKPVGDQWTIENFTLGTTAISLGTTHFTQRTSTVATKGTTQRKTTLKTTTLKATTLKPKTLKVTKLKATTLKATTLKPKTLKVTKLKATTLKATTLKPKTLKVTKLKATTLKATTLKPKTFKVTTLKATTLKATTKIEQPTKPQSKGTTKEMNETTSIEISTQKSGEKFSPGIENRQGITSASFNITKSTLKTSSKHSSAVRNMVPVKTPGVTTSPKTVGVTPDKRVTSPKIDNTTRKIEANCSKPDKKLCGGTNPGTNETSSTNKYLHDSNVEKNSPKPKATTVEVTSQSTVEVTSQMSRSTSVLDLVRDMKKIICGGVNSVPNDTDQDSKNNTTRRIILNEDKITPTKTVEVTTKKIVIQKSHDENLVSTEGRKSSKLKDDIQKPSKSALYNLVAKTAQRKFGLAKITYR